MLKDNEVIHGRRWRRRRRDFWRAWQEERREWEQVAGDHGRERVAESGEFAETTRPSGRGWRDFFHDFMGTWPEQHWAFGGRRFSPWHQGVDAFNPFVAGLLSKGGGLLPIYVLHLLAQQPRYGNELMELIVERTGGQWAANPGAMYPLMTMLENNGLVEGDWEDPRKRTTRVYKLTREGYQELERLKAIVRPKLAQAVAVLNGLANDLRSDRNDSTPVDEVDTVYLHRGF